MWHDKVTFSSQGGMEIANKLCLHNSSNPEISQTCVFMTTFVGKNIDKSLKGRCNYLWNSILAPPCPSANSVGLAITLFGGFSMLAPRWFLVATHSNPLRATHRRAVMHGSLFKYFCLFWCLWSKLLHWHMENKWRDQSSLGITRANGGPPKHGRGRSHWLSFQVEADRYVIKRLFLIG